MQENVNYLPCKDTKTNAYTVRTTDKDNKTFMRIALHIGNQRAPTTVELARLGAQVYAKENGISLREDDLDAFLIEQGVLEQF